MRKILIILILFCLTLTGYSQIDSASTGTGKNTGTGDTWRVGFIKLNKNDRWFLANKAGYPAAGIPNSSGTAWNSSYSTSGSGSILALTNSPSFTTPSLGAATATTINKVVFTAPATSSTLTILNGKTLTANNSITLAGTDGTTITFPSTSATLARTDAANTFTGHQTIEGVTATGATGTGNIVYSNSPAFTGTVSGITASMTGSEPALGNPSTSGYVLSSTAAGVRSWVANGSGGSMTWPGGAGVPNYTGSSTWGTSYTVGTAANNLVQLNASAQLPAINGSLLTNLSGSKVVYQSTDTVTLTAGMVGAEASGSVATHAALQTGVHGISIASGKTLTANNSITLAGTDGTTITMPSVNASLAPLASPSFTTPTLGVATATSINKVTITAPSTSATLTLANGSTLATSGAYSQTFTATGTTSVTMPTGGSLQAGSAASALTAGATITWTPVLQTNNWTLNVGTNATTTINMGTIPSSCVGQTIHLDITTTTTSDVITFGTNIKSQGTLTTGTTASKIFHLTFFIVSTSQVSEVSRTTAM